MTIADQLKTEQDSTKKRFVTFWQWNQGGAFLGIFLNPNAKEAFFVRSFTRRVKNEAAKSPTRKAMEGGGCPFITRIHLDTWNNKTRGRASQRFPFGPWPFVAVNNLAKATAMARGLHLQIYITSGQFMQYLYMPKNGCKEVFSVI